MVEELTDVVEVILLLLMISVEVEVELEVEVEVVDDVKFAAIGSFMDELEIIIGRQT
jgi:hypothetical protein